MKILAIDTATECCSAALLVDGQVTAREMETERGAADHILPMVDELIAEAGLRLADLDAVAFGRGPGGFTGVRLAASVVQGLAFAADLPVVPVSDLAAVAARAFDMAPDVDRVVVCNDARMKEVYWACFERGTSGAAALVGVEHVSAPGAVEVPEHWRAGAIGAAGRGFRAYPELKSKLVDAEHLRLISDNLLPHAGDIARWAVTEMQAGRAVRAEEALPVYLRDDVAKPAVTKLT